MRKGKVVISKSGRDKGNLFVIVEVEDNYVYIANGKLRKIENPKKKNIKHIQLTNKSLMLDEKLTNKQLNKMILNLNNGNY